MEDETEIPETQAPPTDVQPPAPPAQAALPAAPASKVISLPTEAMARIKNDARAQGKAAALAELDAKAKEYGYASHAEMMLGAQNFRLQQTQAQQTQPAAQLNKGKTEVEEQAPAPDPSRALQRELNKLRAENMNLVEKTKQQNRARAHEERLRREAEQQLAAAQAEHELKLAAQRAGIVDDVNIGYAMHLLQSEYAGKSAEELASFNENEFFQSLRTSRPYLYGEQNRPVDTTPRPVQQAPVGGAAAAAGGEAPNGQPGARPAPTKTPAPPKVAAAGAPAAKKSVSEMSREEFDLYLKNKGLDNPSSSPSF